MIQILDNDRVRLIPGVHHLVPCVLCGDQGWIAEPVHFKPYVRHDGMLSMAGGRYSILYCHDTCYNNGPEPLDYVLRQRGGVPHSFSLRN